MNSNQLKTAVINYFEDKQFLASFTESYNNSDVLGVKRTLYTQEVEVKVSRGDLLAELNDIDCAVKGWKVVGKWVSSTKYFKHCQFLKSGKYISNYSLPTYIPNEYCIAVPEELVALTLERLEGTPYGVLSARWEKYYDRMKLFITEAKKPVKLSMEKLGTKEMAGLLSKASYEAQNLRRKLYATQQV